MTQAERQAAADLLWEHWDGGRRLAALPEALRPSTRAEAYAVQALLERRSDAPLFGWKIAATSQAGQRHINVDGPLAGRLLHEKAFGDSDMLPLGANHMRVAEAEFAFRMSTTLPPRDAPYGTADVLAAAGALHLAIEIPNSRYDDFTSVGAFQLIADNACAHLFVLGPEVPDFWRETDLAARVVTASAGAARHAGTGANVLGDPLVALTWLANELSGLGVALKAGEVVTTGTCVVPVPIAAGDTVIADFGTFGTVSARIA